MNNPYQSPQPRVIALGAGEYPPADLKRVWNRFMKVHSKMYHWHQEGKFHLVNRRMPDWEQRNREAWARGLDVPDQFDPTAPKPMMTFRA